VNGRPIRVLVGLSIALVVAFAAIQGADARVGGGDGFSSGGGGYSSGGGGGGDGEILVDIFILLLHLCIEYPAIGIPLLILFLAGVAIRFLFFDGGRPSYGSIGVTSNPYDDFEPTRRRGRSGPVLAPLLEADAAFSVPVFLDFAGLVYRRSMAATRTAEGSSAWAALAPFVSDRAREQLLKAYGQREVTDVILGATRLKTVQVRNRHRIQVEFETNLTTTNGQRYERSTWWFGRDGGATSLPPDETLALGCPNCGNPVETTSMGLCTTCDSPITKGQLQWQVEGFDVQTERAVTPPKLSRTGGGKEPGVFEPTVFQDGLGSKLRAFRGRHRDFDTERFKQRVHDVYFALQKAWSANDWDDARPFVTDPLYQQLRFWIEGYRREGLRNQLTDIALHEVQIVKVSDDAWYESITVRILGSMKDATLNERGEVVSGNAEKTRTFSEYWTFLRASGTGAGSPKPADSCPSCGAPLDRIGSSGVCGYCDSKITTGRFDWVLSRIDQPEVYRG
jgi:hypothetical protein